MTLDARHGLAVVTGASSGVGAALARELDTAGYPVLALARRSARLDELNLRHGMTSAVDVRDNDAVAAILMRATNEFGPVELLVNNAGVMPLGDIANQDSDEWKYALELNTLAPMRLSQHVLPSMLARRRGTIVMITSLAARDVFSHHGAYCASKHALHAFTKALRIEAGPTGVRVIEIAPGMINTDLIGSTTSEQLRDDYLTHYGAHLAPEYVAIVVRQVFEQPQSVCVREVEIVSTYQV